MIASKIIEIGDWRVEIGMIISSLYSLISQIKNATTLFGAMASRFHPNSVIGVQ
jgi:hypothetical protein